MKWHNRGLIFQPGQYWWCQTHGMLPVAEHLDGDYYRVYFSGRDKDNESHIGALDMDILTGKIENLPSEPILSKGELGTFDDCGVSPTWLENLDSRKYLYYMGWHQDGTVRANEMTGLAVWENGNLIHRTRAPVFKPSENEPFGISVITCIEDGKAYYDSCDKWLRSDMPRYNIKIAEQNCGWERAGEVAIDYEKGETRVSCARVIGDEMWFCSAKQKGYKLGYARYEHEHLTDPGRWYRYPIKIPRQTWDSRMQCYPFPIVHKGQRFLLYNGSGYGATGFGYAEET